MNNSIRAAFIAIVTPLLLVIPAGTTLAETAPPRLAILDEQGREIVPSGYVTITEDMKGTVRYIADDYRRMVRMGANFQVIRVTLGRLGGWPGKAADPDYLKQLDAMVRMAREAGLKTIFKLVVYDIRPFGHAQWDAIYHNSDGSQDALLTAWRKIWIRYKDDPSVFGYDLLNEPQRGLDPDEKRCCREDLLPTLRRLADAMHAVSPDKWALYQPLYREVGTGEGPFLPMTEPFGRDRVIYAPHLYAMDLAKMNRMLNRYVREARLSNAPLLLGEWGPATDLAADTSEDKQERYRKVYQATAKALDQRGVGAIKAWFCGTRAPLRAKNRPAPFTWAIFSDTTDAGRVERKFITDTLARPRPLAVAGRIESYGYDFKTRVLEVKFQPKARLGNTEIFVPAERFYPNGFRLEIGSDLALALKPGQTRLQTLKSTSKTSHEQARYVAWNAALQHILIKDWIVEGSALTLRIEPICESLTTSPR